MSVRDGYKMTEVGEIPNEWDIKKLDSIVEKITDGTHKTPIYTESGIPFLRVTDIQETCIDWNNVKYISKQEHDELTKRCKPEIGDILYSKNGTIGIPKIIDWDKEFSIFVSLCLIKIKKSDSEVINKYLEKFLSSDCCLNQIKVRAKQGTVTNLHLEEIRELIIPLPPLPEQQRIAEILSSNDALITKTDELIEKTKEIKQGLMQELLTKGIGHTEFKDSELGRIPKEWEVGLLTSIAEIIMGQSPTGDTYNEFKIGTPLLNGPTEFGRINPTPVQWTTKPTKMCKPKDILFCVRGSSTGRMNISDGEYCIGRGLAAIRNLEELSYTPYLFHLLGYIIEKVLALTGGTTFPNISGEALRSFKIAIPTLNEQQEIASVLSAIDNKLEALTKRKKQLEEIKQGLMQDLLTGRVRV